MTSLSSTFIFTFPFFLQRSKHPGVTTSGSKSASTVTNSKNLEILFYHRKKEITKILSWNYTSCNDTSLFLIFKWVEKWIINHDAFYRRKMPNRGSKDTQFQTKVTTYTVSKICCCSTAKTSRKVKSVLRWRRFNSRSFRHRPTV